MIKIQRIERIPVDPVPIEKFATNDATDSPAKTTTVAPLVQRLSATNALTTTKSNKSNNGFLIFCVYGSAAFVYAQFIVLIYGLNSSYTPPGLIFLVVSLAYIGYIILKVSLYSIINFSQCM